LVGFTRFITQGAFQLGASSEHRGEDIKGEVWLVIVDLDLKERSDGFAAESMDVRVELDAIKSALDEKDKQVIYPLILLTLLTQLTLLTLLTLYSVKHCRSKW
jgi:hypothetical protein